MDLKNEEETTPKLRQTLYSQIGFKKKSDKDLKTFLPFPRWGKNKKKELFRKGFNYPWLLCTQTNKILEFFVTQKVSGGPLK